MEKINKFIDSHLLLPRCFPNAYFTFLVFYLRAFSLSSSLFFTFSYTLFSFFAISGLNISRTAASDVVTHKSQNIRPDFRTLLPDVYVDVGRSIEVECALIGDPMPTVLWKFNGVPITNSDRFKVSKIYKYFQIIKITH